MQKGTKLWYCCVAVGNSSAGVGDHVVLAPRITAMLFGALLVVGTKVRRATKCKSDDIKYRMDLSATYVPSLRTKPQQEQRFALLFFICYTCCRNKIFNTKITMQKATKTVSLLFFLSFFSYTLHAAKSVHQQSIQNNIDYKNVPSPKRKLLVDGYCRVYDVPKEIGLFIIYFVYGNPLQYKNKPLPNDLSEQDLSGFDFTGCAFTYTNLTYTDLTNVILTNTTCDYQKAFQDNIKKNKIEGGRFYRNNLPRDLKSIAQVYPKLNNNTHKAKLLQVASAFSQLPFYEGTEFYIKVEYWSSELVQLKKVLGNPYGQQLVCSIQSSLEYDANKCCWTTNYPQNKVNIEGKAPHANFDTYLKEFTNGLTKYQCKAKESLGFDWYKNNITKNIEGLAATYPHIKKKQLQEEARDIAHALSKSYQTQQMVLLNHYLFFQNRLIRLKKSVGVGVKNKVHYNKIS